MYCEILSLQNLLFKGDVASLSLPSHSGPCEILDRHATFIIALKQGIITVKDQSGQNQTFTIESGVGTIANDEAYLCVTSS